MFTRTPMDCVITSNDGSNLSGYNTRTGETFSGALSEFNAKFDEAVQRMPSKAYTPVNLTSAVRSASFKPYVEREFFCRISGSGNGTVTLVYSYDGGTIWTPKVVAVNGGAPITMNQVAYNNSPVILTAFTDRVGMLVAALPGTISGTVTVEFGQ